MSIYKNKTQKIDKDALLELEQTARQLEPTALQRQTWNQQIQQYADDFIDQIEVLKAYDDFEETPNQDFDIAEQGRPLETLLDELNDQVDRQGINPASGGHLGYVPGGGLFPTAMGDYLAAVTNRYAGLFFANPGAVRMENNLLRWMCNMTGYPEGSLGNLASGGSIANLIAITTARDVKGIKAEKISQSVIYLTDQVHHCVQKAGAADLSPELTKHFRGLRMWLPLQLFGLKPFRAALQEKRALCLYFYEQVQKIGFEVGPEPELSIMTFRYPGPDPHSDAFNAQIVEYVRKDGRVFLSSTQINDQFWIRLAVLSFRTHLREIELCLQVLQQAVTKLKLIVAQNEPES